MPARDEPSDPEQEETRLHRQQRGDEHANAGFRYECACRTRWLLGLRGTGDELSVAKGEDARLKKENGNIVYRQVKKRGTSSDWTFGGIREFVENAYSRFIDDRQVTHEFYTNHFFSDELIDKGHLKSAHGKVEELAGADAEQFSAKVKLLADHKGPSKGDIAYEILDQVKGSYPGTSVDKLVNMNELDSVMRGLYWAEWELWQEEDKRFRWVDVEERAELDKLVASLPARAKFQGALRTWAEFRTLLEEHGEDERAKALTALEEGSAIGRTFIGESSENFQRISRWIRQAAHPEEAEAGSLKGCLVVFFKGPHGSGKTWALMDVARRLLSSHAGLAIYVAMSEPPPSPGSFAGVAALSGGPCVVLIDDLFESWEGPLSDPENVSQPLLFLITADAGYDSSREERIKKRLGRRRVGEVEVPLTLDSSELEELGNLRRLEMGVRETIGGRAKNVRHAFEMATGVLPAEHLREFRELVNNERALLEYTKPILVCTALSVAIPRLLLERHRHGALPHKVLPWLTIRKKMGLEWVLFEDADEAEDLLTKILGGALEDARRSACVSLVNDAREDIPEDRTFVRLLLSRLTSGHAFAEVLTECSQRIEGILMQEPLWAIVFTWLPILGETEKKKLLASALTKFTGRSPESLAEFALLLEVNKDTWARRFLINQVSSLSESWDVRMLARLVEMHTHLPKEAQREPACHLTSFLVDLPPEHLFELLRTSNCFQEATSLAANYGEPEDRKAFLGRVTELIHTDLRQEKPPKLNWLAPYLALANHVIMQGRNGVALEIFRKAIVEGNPLFPVREYYEKCHRIEGTWTSRPAITLGIKLLKSAARDPSRVLKSIPEKFIEFAGTWGDEGEWQDVAAEVLGVLENLAGAAVPTAFDRISSIVQQLFTAVGREPRFIQERFLKIILAWVPKEGTVATEATGSLVLKLIGFVKRQNWLENQLRSSAAETLFTLCVRPEDAQASANRFLGTLFDAIGQPPPTFHAYCGLPDPWFENHSLVTSYLIEISRIPWNDTERRSLAQAALKNWKNNTYLPQPLAMALVRLHQDDDARVLAGTLTKEKPNYPDPYAILAICHARNRRTGQVLEMLKRIVEIRKTTKTNLHPPVAYLLHSELAAASTGREKLLHMLCAALCHDSPLPPYTEVVAAANAG